MAAVGEGAASFESTAAGAGQFQGIELDAATIGAVVAALGGAPRPVALDRACLDRQIRELRALSATWTEADVPWVCLNVSLGPSRVVAVTPEPVRPGPPRARARASRAGTSSA